MRHSSPYVSIIIPAYNRWDALRQTLDALEFVDYPRQRWEVVVVDDGSSEDLESGVKEWKTNTQASVRFIRQENAGPSAARNRGATAAKGDILIFIDNDILVRPDFVRAHVETLNVNPNCWIVGRIVHPPELRGTPFGRYRDSLWETFHNSLNTESAAEIKGITAANVSLPAADFHRLGGFDESFTIASSEDWDLAWRARQIGTRILYQPSIAVVHNDWAAVSLERFRERYRLYSFSDVLLWHKYGDECMRANLMHENSLVDFKRDSAQLIVKKALKGMLATRLGTRLLELHCRLWERLAPDSQWNYRAYNMVAAVGIFRGVRDGLKYYKPMS